MLPLRGGVDTCWHGLARLLSHALTPGVPAVPSQDLVALGIPSASWWGCPLQAVGRPNLAGVQGPIALLLLECLAEPVFDGATTVTRELINL